MSAQAIETVDHHDGAPDLHEPALEITPEPVEIRRNAGLSLVVGAAASAIAIAYLYRAAGTGGFLDWVLCLAIGALAVVHLRALLDARIPLLVADELGVRIRLGAQWRGVPWEAIDRVLVQPRRGLLRDGRLILRLHHLERAIEGLEGRAHRHATLNRKVYGAALAVPLGLTTRFRDASSGGDGDTELCDRIARLAGDRAEVLAVVQDDAPVLSAAPPAPVEAGERAVIDDAELREERRPRWLRRPERSAPVEEDQAVVEDTAVAEDSMVVTAVPAIDDATVRPLARLAEPVAPLVIDDFQPEPAYDPVIGPELAAARTRVGLTVDSLADRTRIRPHVIESIEVDDFAPCGGDFYARGHIRTLARVLGKDPEPLLARFDARYAQAPINARRVFEAELATGLHGGMRRTYGGPNWTLLVGVVLALVLVWSVVRLFAGTDNQMIENPPPVLNGSAGLSDVYGAPSQADAPPPVETVLTAANAGTRVEVRDGEGELVFEGDLVIGEVKKVEAQAPVTITSDNGGALEVTLAGRDMGVLGDPDLPATRTFQAPSR